MARISYTATIAEYVGRLAGSVFQYSYGGYQVHSRVTPSNPQTERQQLRRGWFGWFAANWRNLSTAEQLTWITAAGTVPEAFRLFVQANINLYLIGEPTLTSYVADPQPVPMQLLIDAYDATNLEVIAFGTPSIVPADRSLLLFMTAEKTLPRLFRSPSEYYPLITFPAGTDFSSAVSVIAEWEAFFGQISGGKRLCLNSVLISTINGGRSVDNITCSPVAPSVTERIMDSDGTFIIDYDGAYVVQPQP